MQWIMQCHIFLLLFFKASLTYWIPVIITVFQKIEMQFVYKFCQYFDIIWILHLGFCNLQYLS